MMYNIFYFEKIAFDFFSNKVLLIRKSFEQKINGI